MNKRILYSYNDIKRYLKRGLSGLSLMIPVAVSSQTPQITEIDQVQVSGEMDEGRGEFHLMGSWSPDTKSIPVPEPLISVTAHSMLEFDSTELLQRIKLEGSSLQGITTNWIFNLRGDATIRRAVGEHIRSWSVTESLDGSRQLVLNLF